MAGWDWLPACIAERQRPTLGSQLESLGISTDFCAGVLAARQVEEASVLASAPRSVFAVLDLEKIGGFESFADYLADDYELGKRISALGLKVKLSPTVVETFLPAYSMSELWGHQLRWSRASAQHGLAGTLDWPSHSEFLGAAIVDRFGRRRLGMGAVRADVDPTQRNGDRGWGMGCARRSRPPRLWLLPLRDLIAVAVWIVSFAGNTVTWRGDRFKVENGKLIKL